MIVPNAIPKCATTLALPPKAGQKTAAERYAGIAAILAVHLTLPPF